MVATVHHAWPAELFDLGCQKIKQLLLVDWVENEVPILYLQKQLQDTK